MCVYLYTAVSSRHCFIYLCIQSYLNLSSVFCSDNISSAFITSVLS
jgi:hypothetical protein